MAAQTCAQFSFGSAPPTRASQNSGSHRKTRKIVKPDGQPVELSGATEASNEPLPCRFGARRTPPTLRNVCSSRTSVGIDRGEFHIARNTIRESRQILYWRRAFEWAELRDQQFSSRYNRGEQLDPGLVALSSRALIITPANASCAGMMPSKPEAQARVDVTPDSLAGAF